MADAPTKIELEVVTPAKLLLSVVADMVVVPGAEGDFGVLPGHAPMISTVRAGTVNVYEDDKIVASLFVEGGFAEVTAGRCTVLAENAQMVTDIDHASAEKRLAAARTAQSADTDHVDGLDSAEVRAAEAMAAAASSHK
ncbi:MAG: ATP synthase F1 subunit epsilon [Rhodospirillaceae bacterium]|nr:ATP synthase F1 subunit epsilon [Rhodospirillaceae bacterium]